jgi:hypothetical protein
MPAAILGFKIHAECLPVFADPPVVLFAAAVASFTPAAL